MIPHCYVVTRLSWFHTLCMATGQVYMYWIQASWALLSQETTHRHQSLFHTISICHFVLQLVIRRNTFSFSLKFKPCHPALIDYLSLALQCATSSPLQNCAATDSLPSSLARVTSINTQPVVLSCQPLPSFTGLQLKQGQKFKTDISIESSCWHWGANTDQLKACCCIFVGRDQRMQVQGKRWALLKSRKEVLSVSLSTPLGCINFR